jgi:hypothetical protein
MPQQLPLLRGQIALVDSQDYPWLSAYKWRLNSRGYVIRTYTVNGREVYVCLHREIMNAKPGHVIGHRDHDKLNNTRANLRFVTQQQNTCFRRRFANNTSGYKGVNWQNDRWHARIEVDEHAIHLGHFDDPGMAALAYDAAATRLFGEFALPNFPDSATPSHIGELVEQVLARHGL